jgi:2-keto-4-pentenoate hydratase/2-oxohepta-3-ene-1,7-dioic acid hydratase in catechol pathway
MKLLRCGPPGQERPALLDENGVIRDLSGYINDLSGSALADENLARIAQLDAGTLPIIDSKTRVGPCVAGTGKVICAGLNYADHAAETKMPLPKEPILFMKATSSICGPYDNVELPPGAQKVDWEVELGVVIGKPGSYIDESRAMDHVAGYCIVNDISERSYQLDRGGQWVKGKSCDTFCPIGPWLVTRDEIADPQSLDLWLSVDEVRRQNGNTRTMVFDVRTLISYISQFMSLQAGDIIATGTPPGVGMGIKPTPIYLSAGQTMRLGVEGLGVQEQLVRARQS